MGATTWIRDRWDLITENGVLHGPATAFSYDNGDPGAVAADWTPSDGTPSDGTRVHVTMPTGARYSLNLQDASRLSIALRQVIASLGRGRLRTWLSDRRRKVAGLAGAAAVVLLLGGYALGGWAHSGGPSYSIAYEGRSGPERSVLVQVHHSQGVRSVINAVTDRLHGDATYRIQVTCTSGAKLAAASYVAGPAGTKVSSLDEGAVRYERFQHATCHTTH